MRMREDDGADCEEDEAQMSIEDRIQSVNREAIPLAEALEKMNACGNPHSQIESLQRALADARITTARRCIEIAMERCRVLKGFAIVETRLGRDEVANRFDSMAHQFEWIADAIRREFGIKEE